MSPPDKGASVDQGAPAQVASWLQRFLILMAVISAIACAFVWQANAIADVQARTYDLRLQAVSIEQENAGLMVQLAALDSPANVEREAARLGLVNTRAPKIRVYAALASEPAEGEARPVPPGQPRQGAQGGFADRAGHIPDRLASLANDVATLAGLHTAPATDAAP